MNEQIEIKRSHCLHCGKEIARIPDKQETNKLAFDWKWFHLVTLQEEECLFVFCSESSKRAEPIEKEQV